MKVTIPPNTTASVYLPADINSQVYENSSPTEQSEDVRFIKIENGNAIYHTGSGSYDFLVFEKK
jgi:alpha-L-rhamnosidase